MYLNTPYIINNMYDCNNNIVWSFPNGTLLNLVTDTWHLITYYYDNYYTFAVCDQHYYSNGPPSEKIPGFRIMINSEIRTKKFKKYFSKMYNKHNNLLSFIKKPFDNNYNYSLCTATHTLGLEFCKYDNWKNKLILVHYDKGYHAQLKYWDDFDRRYYEIEEQIDKIDTIDMNLQRKIYLYVRNDIVF